MRKAKQPPERDETGAMMDTEIRARCSETFKKQLVAHSRSRGQKFSDWMRVSLRDVMIEQQTVSRERSADRQELDRLKEELGRLTAKLNPQS